jgi:uncharacterized protein
MLCLSISLLLWLDGLAGSLERPSVVDSLSLRQLELAVLAEDLVPPPLRPALVGDDPRGTLAGELKRQIDATDTPAPAVQRLELALLQRSDERLRALVEMVDPPRRLLLEALLGGRREDPMRQRQLLFPWRASPLVNQLGCEQLGGPASACPAAAAGARLLLQLVAVNVVPAVMLLVGILLLARQLWLKHRGRLPAAAPLVGPPLGLVDVTLLIAGGFVLVGEVLIPPLLLLPLQSLNKGLELPEAVGQGVQVLGLYLGLMAAPLLLLRWMLPPRAQAPAGGWLQWHWRPLATALRQALAMLLMVLPAVALCGWLIERFWGDPGGSNPMLELVLTSADPLALLCFAFTAIVLAPLFEETLFRGVLLPVVAERLGGGYAVLVSAAVFALAHLSLGELAPLFLLGIGLGWLRWRSGRLGASVLMHALWNGLTFLNLLLLSG